MNRLFYLIKIINVLIKLNLFKTIYFNFKYLPISQAKKLPVYFYGKTKFTIDRGNFKIDSPKIFSGMIVFGGKHERVISPSGRTRIFNTGTIIFKGEIKFGIGLNIMVRKPGILNFGNNVSIGSLCNIIVFKEINFGSNVLVSWDCQIFDTDFHFIIKDNSTIANNISSVDIEENVWIGTRVLILKNTIIGKNSIIGSNSLCNKNYKTLYGNNVLLAGVPVKCISQEVQYLRNKRMEMQLLHYFSENSIHKLNTEEIHQKLNLTGDYLSS